MLKQWQLQLLESLDEWDQLEFHQEVEFLPFEEAREFVRSLKFKSVKEWNTYCQSEHRSKNVPWTPSTTYKNLGWVSWGDWLGTGVIAAKYKTYLPFEEAKEFVRSLKLEGQVEWSLYRKSNNKPDNIPSNPNRTYKEDWISWGDWLGNGKIKRGNWRSFEETRKFVRSLNFQNQTEFFEYCKSGNKPDNIPSNPNRTYKEDWISWGDWLGNGKIKRGNWRSFEEAREFVRSVGLETIQEWYDYIKLDNKPSDIPICPNKTYKDVGWISFSDWFGTEKFSNKDKNKLYLPFEKAREFAQSFKLNSRNEWNEYCKLNKLKNIPTNPQRTYKTDWISWGDWLGTGYIKHKKFLLFEEARKFTISLKLKTYTDWYNYCKFGNKPNNIPSNPNQEYKDKGWISMSDWLGK